ncbi:DUF1996 domain-containing protein [Micromonospora sp. WMMD980]|uniref:DUF1996 domain-containing protein n=1 Tax=Micromonospora sp. WMMD980 TaxID=3016088 RepID=UPI0024161F37|nr:DUF1996 domain-containing protein [Micromonospora sp. WMMD980]MDG4801981.1 DUF1996 domain-containing protein [Micromonospora sp. WMMD980]
MSRRYRNRRSRGATPTRLALVAVVLAATGALTATFVSSGGKGTTDAATSLSDYVAIERIRPNVVAPRTGPMASTGRFTVDCGTNRIGKFSPDNPVAQPGVRNGAEHVHDFVGNLAITADSSDAVLAASGTTCVNGDRSSYFWPVVRIDRSVRAGARDVRRALAATPGAVVCPTVGDRLPAVPVSARAAVDRRLAEFDRLEAAADRRVRGTRGADIRVNNDVLNWLRVRRAATLTAIGDTIRAAGGRAPTGLVALADCDVSYDGIHTRLHTAHTTAASAATPQVTCPSVRDRLPGVPRPALAEVDRGLADLDRQIAEANQRLVTSRGAGDAGFVENAVLGPLRAKRTALLKRIADAVGRSGARTEGLDALAPCTVDRRSGQPATPPTTGASPLPEPQGPNLELPNNTGRILRPEAVVIEYRGNAVGKVVPMPRFLRELTGDAKPTSRGPANARATWTCSGFGDRLSDKYPICPAGSRVQRVQDFPGCWDGRNTDSANHRDHVAFADRSTGACPQGFTAIPQVRITISYDIPRGVQRSGRYALDSFPEENHNPFSDHNDFVNVNSTRTMERIAACLNGGRNCR